MGVGKKVIGWLLAMALAGGLTACGAETPQVQNPVATGAVAKDAAAATTAAEPAPGLCGYHVTGETDLPGAFYLSFVYSRNLIMLDGKGNLIWSKHEEPVADGVQTGFWDFKKHVIDGKTYYSYHNQTGAYDNWGMEGFARASA